MSTLSRNELKYLSSLQRKKDRQEHKQCIVEGVRLCEDALNSGWTIHEWFVTEDFKQNPTFVTLSNLSGIHHLKPTVLTIPEMQKITTTRNPQGIALLVDIPETRPLEPTPDQHPRIVLLDGISDPGNLGTIMRSADWFGLRDIAYGSGTVEWTNPKVLRASMGAAFRLNIFEINNWNSQIKTLKTAGYRILSADMHGLDPREFDTNKYPFWGLILGNEAHGVSPQLHSMADYNLSIPGEGAADSLNVAMAGTVLLYELSR